MIPESEHNFIKANLKYNLAEIALQLSKNKELDKDLILKQINGLQKAKDKLPEWAKTEGLLFPPALSMEQCSSEATAKFKAAMFQGKAMADLTAGFGVDSYYFSKNFEKLYYVEEAEPLFQLVRQNFNTLNANNIQPIHQTAEEFLKSFKEELDLIYLDPARRKKDKKVFLLDDCRPNILELKEALFQRSPQVLIKTSPLLDLKLSAAQLGNVEAIHVIAVNNECKELLFLMKRGYEGTPRIYAHHLLAAKTDNFSFEIDEELNSPVRYAAPQRYLYEPNAALLKAGAFRSIAATYDLLKLAPNSHLYTSNQLLEDFPGRTFECHRQLNYQKKALKSLGISKANVSTRNFKATVDEVRKKLKLKAGGHHYIFATSLEDGAQCLLLCSKIQ